MGVLRFLMSYEQSLTRKGDYYKMLNGICNDLSGIICVI